MVAKLTLRINRNKIMNRIEVDVTTGEIKTVSIVGEELDALLAQAAVYEKEKPKILIKEKIANLEATITPRRTREAILAIDTTWLAEQEAAIALLRTQL
jgi:hypothetical protein